ncbi:MAG: phosphoribosylamine--glycine ligase [Chloroflexi bacterium]|nr:phosphoribosylamine--glycine ligase [Chloroflexota bacterium]
MNVLLLGSGAREHAIAWKLSQSPKLTSLYVAPGNPGTADVATNLPVSVDDFEAIVRTCKEQRIDLVVVGSEGPLAAGLVDRLLVEGIAAFGPAKSAAIIESSKVFSKQLMARIGIPTATFGVFDNEAAARKYVDQADGSLVIKADGLAVGKGAIVTDSSAAAHEAVTTIMRDRAFGAAGDRVVIEQRLYGPEVSAHAFTDGQTVAHMPFSCDHKPVFDGDQGPNTGGMGAYSPPGWFSDADQQWARESVTEAAIKAMYDAGLPYKGVLYPGILCANDGMMVLEFNSRFGDPEAQVLFPRLESDLLEVMWAVANNKLAEVELRWSDEACVGVVLASGGYPAKYKTGLPIEGIDELDPDVLVFHAGTARQEDGTLVTSGGRVLTVSALGPDLQAARDKAYRNVERIRFEGMHYRRDIGARAVAAPN